MLTAIHPKLPMRDKLITRNFYCDKLGFKLIGLDHFDDYLMLKRDEIELHFFKFVTLNPTENYGQIYICCHSIEEFYKELIAKKVTIHPNGVLGLRPWGIKEFSILDPDLNLLTFGEQVD
jgi:catechol 2,3-dioxygenase-like lactoylglutathione lyase family enzyme